MEQMNVTSARYILHPDTSEVSCINAIIDDERLVVPLDPANRHYAEIMRQVEAGELTIQPAPSGSQEADNS